MISDVNLAKEVLVKHFQIFHDPPSLPEIFNKDGKHKDIFTARGDYWKKLRAILSPTFSTGKMKMVDTKQVSLISSLHSLVCLSTMTWLISWELVTQ